MIWELQNQLTATTTDARLEELKGFLFTNRGLLSEKQRTDFLNPTEPDLKIIESLDDLDQASLANAKQLIEKAIADKQPILVYGDYDCDGICATAVLWETLFELGARAFPFIPKREEHGYGLSKAGLEEALKKVDQPPLIVTVDGGITAAKVVEEFNHQGLKFIITDHHQKPEILPKAITVHTTKLCGTGVAWLLASFLKNKTVPTELVALATVCDLVPLVGPNRRLVVSGLKQLRTTSRPGLLALYELAGIKDPSTIDTYHLGFVIGPRINAVGRLGHGLDALRLLCTRKPLAAVTLARQLSEQNQDRQVLTERYAELVKQEFGQQKTLPKVLVMANEEFHEGVIGLVAARIVELYSRPAVVVSMKNGIAKGSARSVPGIHITELLKEAGEGLAEVGGHVGAAGFKLNSDDFDKFRQRILEISEKIDEKLLVKRLLIESNLEATDLSFELLKLLEQFSPFGFGNEKPLFSITTELAGSRKVGKQANHLQLQFKNQEKYFEGIGFNFVNRFVAVNNGQELELAFYLENNTFRGNSKLQLNLKDFRVVTG